MRNLELRKNKFNTKIVILGNGSVGKTSLRRSYLGKSFNANYLQTIGADFSVTYSKFENLICQNAIWDIAGQDKFEITHAQYFRGAHAAIIVFDVTNRSSFENMNYWIERYTELSSIGKVISIVANKCDLKAILMEEEINNFIEKIIVDYPDIRIKFYYTSAKIGTNIKLCFDTTVIDIIELFTNVPRFKINRDILFERYILAAYITTYDEVLGPTIIKKSPAYGTYSDKEFINSIKVASSIDIDTLAGASNILASMPWSDPNGYYHYIAFTDFIENDKKIYFIGFVCKRDINNLISGKYGIISGFFHSIMNSFNQILRNKDQSLVEIASKTVKLDDILLKFRINIFELIKNEL